MEKLIPFGEIDALFTRFEGTLEKEMSTLGVQYSDTYKAGYYASMIRMLAWHHPEAKKWLENFTEHMELKRKPEAA